MNKQMNYQKYVERSSPCDRNKVLEEISSFSGMSTSEIMRRMPSFIGVLTPAQREVFKLWFNYNKPILEIRYSLGANSFSDIERKIQASLRRIKNLAYIIVHEGGKDE